MKFIHIYTNVYCTELYLSKCNGFWDICIKYDMNFNFEPFTTFVLWSYTKTVSLKLVNTLKIYWYTKFHGPMLSGVSLISISEVRKAIILERLKLRDKKIWGWGLQWHNLLDEFHKSILTGAKVIGGHTDRETIRQTERLNGDLMSIKFFLMESRPKITLYFEKLSNLNYLGWNMSWK
jgi:hypothetical protein